MRGPQARSRPRRPKNRRSTPKGRAFARLRIRREAGQWCWPSGPARPVPAAPPTPKSRRCDQGRTTDVRQGSMKHVACGSRSPLLAASPHSVHPGLLAFRHVRLTAPARSVATSASSPGQDCRAPARNISVSENDSGWRNATTVSSFMAYPFLRKIVFQRQDTPPSFSITQL